MTAKQGLYIGSAVCFALIGLGIGLGPLVLWALGVMFYMLAQAF